MAAAPPTRAAGSGYLPWWLVTRPDPAVMLAAEEMARRALAVGRRRGPTPAVEKAREAGPSRPDLETGSGAASPGASAASSSAVRHSRVVTIDVGEIPTEGSSMAIAAQELDL